MAGWAMSGSEEGRKRGHKRSYVNANINQTGDNIRRGDVTMGRVAGPLFTLSAVALITPPKPNNKQD